MLLGLSKPIWKLRDYSYLCQNDTIKWETKWLHLYVICNINNWRKWVYPSCFPDKLLSTPHALLFQSNTYSGIAQPLPPSTFPKMQMDVFFLSFSFFKLGNSSSPDGDNKGFQIRTIHFLQMKEDSHLPYYGPLEFLTGFTFARWPWRSSWYIHLTSFPPLTCRL